MTPKGEKEKEREKSYILKKKKKKEMNVEEGKVNQVRHLFKIIAHYAIYAEKKKKEKFRQLYN